MEQSREERVQQRLRGASRRPIKDVDFGFSIPAASAPIPSSPPTNATPPVESSPQPANEHSPSSVPPPPSSSIPDATRAAISHSVNDANTSAKRKKLDSDLPPVSSGRSTRSGRTPRREPHEIPDDDPVVDSLLEVAEQVSAPISTEDTVLEVADEISAPINNTEDTVLSAVEDTVILDAVPEPQQTPSVHFAEETTIISIKRSTNDDLINELLEDTIISQVDESVIATLSQVVETETPVPAGKRQRKTLEESPKQRTPIEEDDVDELSPEQPATRVSRPRAIVREPIEDEERDPLSDPAEPEEAQSINDQEAATILSKTKGKRKSIDPASASRGDEVDDLELPRSKRQRKQDRQESNRAEQRQPKKAASKNTKAARKPSNGNAKLRAGSPIDITIHRLSRPTVFDEEQTDADILNAEITHRKRAGVNAIDVLRGLCEEIVASIFNTLKEGQSHSEDAAQKREYATKARAVESFGNEIDTRLVEHTVNLDNAYALERRVKDENKKKLNIREEILRVRAEREKVALRMDEIRIRHENETNSSRELNTLNTAVHDIELAVSRGQIFESDESTIQPPGISSIEILLKRVAGEVSKKGDSGGLLKQIQEFNGFLERTALALENRRV